MVRQKVPLAGLFHPSETRLLDTAVDALKLDVARARTSPRSARTLHSSRLRALDRHFARAPAWHFARAGLTVAMMAGAGVKKRKLIIDSTTGKFPSCAPMKNTLKIHQKNYAFTSVKFQHMHETKKTFRETPKRNNVFFSQTPPKRRDFWN